MTPQEEEEMERRIFDGMTWAEWWEDMQCGGENTYMKLSSWEALKIVLGSLWRDLLGRR